MQETCDMHIHTDNSDGILSGIELLKLAKKRRLRKLSITDHDCVDFYLDKTNIEMLKDFDYIPGCEFVCSCGNVPIEILGYGININETKDYLDLYEYAKDKEVTKFLSWPTYTSVQEAHNRIEFLVSKYKQEAVDNDYAIELKSENKVIGSIGIVEYEGKNEGSVEIGYVLNANYQGYGYMTEALVAMFKYIKN